MAKYKLPETINAAMQMQTSRHSPEKQVQTAAMLGALVRRARKDMRLNQQQFADLSGVGRRFISELESGKSTLEIDKVFQVCAAAGIDITARRRGA